VQYLVNVQQKGDPFDMHWTPVTHFCTPCQVDFDIIMKFETLQVNNFIPRPLIFFMEEMNKLDYLIGVI
jgi:hypothetical protein